MEHDGPDKDVVHVPISKERYRDSRKKINDQFQMTVNYVDPDDWDDWMDEELFEQFEPIKKPKRKR